MPEIPPEIRAQLAKMSDAEWSALTAQVRAPDSTEALRTAAAKVLPDDAAASFVTFADVSKFLGDDGQVDEGAVRNYITAAYGLPPGSARQYGQHSGDAPGDRGRAAATRRHGAQAEAETATGRNGRGSAGKAAAQARHGGIAE